MYSIPVIVAPAAAVGTGSCQVSVRVRVVSGLYSANASAASTAVPPSGTLTASSAALIASGAPGRTGRR